MMLVPTLLALVVMACGHCDAVSDRDAGTKTCGDAPTSLCERMEHLEGVIGRMQQTMIGQTQQHHDKLSALQRRLLDQEAKLSEQDLVNRQQTADLSQQAVINRQLKEELSQQAVANRRLAEEWSQQVVINSQQAAELSQQDGLIGRQAERLAHQERRTQLLAEAVDVLQHNRAHDANNVEMTLGVVVAAMEGPEDPKAGVLSSESHDALTVPDDKRLMSDDVTTRSEEPLVSHDVLTRSDDAGPLEAVVLQVSQKVTEMSADLQALKTQSNSDIQALKTQSNSDIQALKTQSNSDIQALKNSVLDARTSTFVHWGSSGCGNASQVVYTGIVGGGHEVHHGTGTNYLCLSMSPVASGHALPSAYGLLYGAEYHTYDSHNDMDPVCTVCRAGHSSTVMIPGTNVCTPGWHEQFTGYLMSGHSSHAAGSEFICVDTKLESRVGSQDDHNGKLMFFVVSQCGSLPCEPYVNNKIVTCVVCSQ